MIRRWLRFRLRTMLALVALAAVVLSVREQADRGSTRYWSRVVGRDSAAYKRWEAARSLAVAFEADARVAVAALIRSLRDPSDLVRRTSAAGLSRFPAEAERIIPALCEAIRHRDESTSLAALGTIAQLNDLVPGSRFAAIPSLMALLDDPRPRVRLRAAAVLGDLGMARRISGRVARDLANPSAAIRLEAVRTLRGLGPDACRDEWRSLMPLRKDADGEILVEVATAIRPTHPIEAMMALARASGIPDNRVSTAAREAIFDIGVTANVASALAAMVDGTVLRDRLGAMRALNQIAAWRPLNPTEPGTVEVVSSMARALDDPDESIRLEAASSLGSVGVGSQKAADAMARRLTFEPDPRARRLLDSGLRKLRPRPAP